MSEPDTQTERAADLLFAESKRLLERQQQTLDGLRARAVGLLSSAGIVNGLFGVHSIGPHYPAWRVTLIALALATFGLMAGATIYIEYPREFDFTESPEDWLQALADGTPRRPLAYHAHFAAQFETFRLRNTPKIDKLVRAMNACCLLLGVQVVLWGLSLL